MQPKREVVDNELPNVDISDVLEETEQVVRKCFTKYSMDEVFLSFNGGKDCTVLLDITLNVLRQMHRADDIATRLKIVYIRTTGPFKEIEEFVKDIEEHYKVNLVVTEGELRVTLQRLLEEDEKLKACLMGTRRTDPYSADLEFMQKTDPSWPQIVRVSPLLNWSYHQIWSYVLQRQVPYCCLYEQGYTSIGSTRDTRPNPALGRRAAWLLRDAALERAGRGTAPAPAPNLAPAPAPPPCYGTVHTPLAPAPNLAPAPPPCNGTVHTPLAPAPNLAPAPPACNGTVHTPLALAPAPPACNGTVHTPLATAPAPPPCNGTVHTPLASAPAPPACNGTIHTPLAPALAPPPCNGTVHCKENGL